MGNNSNHIAITHFLATILNQVKPHQVPQGTALFGLLNAISAIDNLDVVDAQNWLQRSRVLIEIEKSELPTSEQSTDKPTVDKPIALNLGNGPVNLSVGDAIALIKSLSESIETLAEIEAKHKERYERDQVEQQNVQSTVFQDLMSKIKKPSNNY